MPARPHALLDFWHTDDEGEYDLSGYRFRGHQASDGAGRYRLETILPGAYSGRTRHIHVRVQAPGGRLLTTQLYFPGEARNETDGIFSARLLMDLTAAGSGREGRFDFVLRAEGGGGQAVLLRARRCSARAAAHTGARAARALKPG